MKKFNIVPMNLNSDKYEIASWEIDHANTPGFERIKEFLLENQTYRGLCEVIETNHELYPIGEDEIKYSYVAKTKNKEIIAWILFDEFDLNTTEPELFLQYICIHPLYQNKGYGEAILSEILQNPKKYMAAKPSKVFAYVKKNNFESHKLFSKFNFSFAEVENDPDYFKAQTNEPKLITENTAYEPGE